MWCTAADKTALLAEGITQAASASPALIRPLTNALFHISFATTACGALGAARVVRRARRVAAPPPPFVSHAPRVASAASAGSFDAASDARAG